MHHFMRYGVSYKTHITEAQKGWRRDFPFASPIRVPEGTRVPLT